MSSCMLSDLQLGIVAHCAEHERRGRSKCDLGHCVIYDGWFIKYGSQKSLYPQYETQEYISRLAEGDGSAPRIPKIYDYFTQDNRMAYLVIRL